MRNSFILLLFLAASMIALKTGMSAATEFKVPAPDIRTAQWLNSEPLDWDRLKGKVVMVEFWTFGCYNCKNVEPYVKEWYKKYRSKGFEIVAVHSPEFDRERRIDNVREYVQDHSITYPVAIDNDFQIWRRFANRYWPAMYIVDKQGMIRYRFIGEGNYNKIESVLRALLAEKESKS